MDNKITGMRIKLQKKIVALIMLGCLAMTALTGCADAIAAIKERDTESDETVFRLKRRLRKQRTPGQQMKLLKRIVQWKIMKMLRLKIRIFSGAALLNTNIQ